MGELASEAPSYHASKAGFSAYLQGLARAVRPCGVRVTNVRFGFVDTKMAKGGRKPLRMSVEQAADHIDACLRKRPVSYTAPLLAVPLVKMLRILVKPGAV